MWILTHSESRKCNVCKSRTRRKNWMLLSAQDITASLSLIRESIWLWQDIRTPRPISGTSQSQFTVPHEAVKIVASSFSLRHAWAICGCHALKTQHKQYPDSVGCQTKRTPAAWTAVKGIVKAQELRAARSFPAVVSYLDNCMLLENHGRSTRLAFENFRT